MFTVADMMTSNPYALSPTHTLADAKDLMEQHGIRHVPIVDENRHLLGLVTQRDVLSAQESSLELITQSNFMSALDIQLHKCMNRSLMSVDCHAGLKEAALYMQKHKIGCLPVVEEKVLVGIITDSDFVSIAVTLLEIQEEVEPMESDA
ncbi:acetoin utilization protein AcuB [Photobacterium jeanii]|uniref:Acetoin utilization protein AcuB n=1 Tax=Photobacterium jeanii TaxID=858640 RepID=A0A178KA91_9GAMM|nr:CBS domain-containing protein [Photobacterium jeanii]OAN14269.1 acetoin utilization protein AcuB [Photobacterium jeanii]PST89790.1 CBS domain-containing protein [Photobacterium jeanii]